MAESFQALLIEQNDNEAGESKVGHRFTTMEMADLDVGDVVIRCGIEPLCGAILERAAAKIETL